MPVERELPLVGNEALDLEGAIPRLPSGVSGNQSTEEIVIERLPAALRSSKRFEMRRVLGRGTFAEVYLAHDRQLSRLVALKVPRTDRLHASDDLDLFLREARAAASLRHSGIVTVYDVHGDADGVYIVLEFIEGCTLAEYASREQLTLDDIVRLMVEIGQAVAYAHEHGLVHRDLKPSNILVDARRNIRIADFGLAIHERGQRNLPRDTAGTPYYMAPEQVRGETHRLDGRTDVWSLGVIFYWLLTGRRAFNGDNEIEVFDEILHSEPRPPRQFFPDLPRELERICLKCMSRRMSDRYATGHDLADDLLHWLDRTGTQAIKGEFQSADPIDRSRDPPSTPVIPKGLRSFDQHDADFYLNLLPGPYDRDGLPECVRFWKQRIEERDPAETFAVGLMYGPSGCGKTSLVRAGVLPRLLPHVRWIYTEVAPQDADKRLQSAIARMLPQLPFGMSLVETLVALREGEYLNRDEKLLIVLDQLEQALDGGESDADNQLVTALRHCDGARLQCLVMVRDDFSMAATRFMNALEIPIVEGHNCGAVDVFRREHAERVLRRFGEAFGRIAADSPGESDRFVKQAVQLIADGNVVAPVRLAAFAELTRHQEWKPSTLRGMGGSEGLGVALLETYFGEATSQPMHRQYRVAAKRLLAALLPEDHTSLKGPMRSRAELMDVVQLTAHPREFENLVNILDKELRLISPADPTHGVCESTEVDLEGSTRRGERYFQLAHDYLVPSLNAWLTAKQRETRGGRAMLALETISADWNARPENRRLPTFFEWAGIRLWTRRTSWTQPQRRMMASAQRRYLARASILGALGAVLVAVLLYAEDQLREQQARSMAQQLLVADISRVPDLLTTLDHIDSPGAHELLQAASEAKNQSDEERLRANLMLANNQRSARDALMENLLELEPQEHRIVTSRLAPHGAILAQQLWQRLDYATSDEAVLRIASALATWDTGNGAWEKYGPRVADALGRCENPYELPEWIESLAPVGQSLVPQLIARFRDDASTGAERASATALVRYLQDNVPSLASLAVDASSESFSLFITALEPHADAAVVSLMQYWSSAGLPSGEAERTIAIRRRAVAAIALARLGADDKLWPLLENSTIPDVRTAIINRCPTFGVPAQLLLDSLDRQATPMGRQSVVIALAEYRNRLSNEIREDVVQDCLRLYRTDPDSGVHSGAEYALRRLDANDELHRARQEIAGQTQTDAVWLINRQGITMIIVRRSSERAQVAENASASTSASEMEEGQSMVPPPYSYAISAHEITVEQFKRFQPEFTYAQMVAPSEDCPIGNLDWLDAVRYCRWLSEEEGIPEEEMCYPPLDQIEFGFELPADWQRRRGYRLPTGAEWKLACQAGATTNRFFGNSSDGLDRYAQYSANSQDRLWSVGTLRPNPWGLFDVFGNVLEWSQDASINPPGDTLIVDEDTERRLYGTSYRSVARENHIGFVIAYPPDYALSFTGLRVVRTLPE